MPNRLPEDRELMDVIGKCIAHSLIEGETYGVIMFTGSSNYHGVAESTLRTVNYAPYLKITPGYRATINDDGSLSVVNTSFGA